MVPGNVMYLFPLQFGLCIRGVTTRPCGYAHLDTLLSTLCISCFNCEIVELRIDLGGMSVCEVTRLVVDI